MRGYLSLIRKDSSTHMRGLILYVKEELRTRLVSAKLCRFLLMCLFFQTLTSIVRFWLGYSGGADISAETLL